MSEQGRVSYGLTGEVGTAPITEYGKKSRVCEHGVASWKCTECVMKKNLDNKIDNKIDNKMELKSPEYFVMLHRKLEEELLDNLLEAMPEIGLIQVKTIMSNRWLILSELMNYDKKLMEIIRERMSND